MKKYNEAFTEFSNNMIASDALANCLYIVRGKHIRFGRDFLEPMRHVRKTPQGIIRQIMRDKCMEWRDLEIIEVDLDNLKCESLWKGKIYE